MADFAPTHAWQDVPDHAILPPGLQVEVDLSTGRKRARKFPQILPDIGLPAIAELSQHRQWVCWKLEHRQGDKWTKVPYQPNGVRADSTDPSTWRSFEECWRAASNGNTYAGVGFVFAEGDGYGEIDLDHVIEGEVVFDWALAIVRLARTYTEISQSGEGLHLVMRTVDIPKGFDRPKVAGSVAGATQGRFLALTGHVLAHQTVKHDCASIADADLGTLSEHPLFQGLKPTNGSAPHGAKREESLRVDEGDLASLDVDVSRSVPAGELSVMLENHPDFRAIWHKRLAPARDGTHSGYMASIARRAIDMGKPPQFAADLIIEFCRMHGRMDKAERRQILRAIAFAMGHVTARTPAIADKIEAEELEEETAIERMEACRDDRAEAMQELSAHFGVEVSDVKRMGEHPGRVMFKIAGIWLDVGTPTQVLGQASVINALHHARIKATLKVKPQKWLRVATLIMLHQRLDDAGNEEERLRIEDWLAGMNLRELEADKSVRWRMAKNAHLFKGLILAFPGSEGLDARSLGLTRTIYTVLREAGFRSKPMACGREGDGNTTTNVWVRNLISRDKKNPDSKK